MTHSRTRFIILLMIILLCALAAPLGAQDDDPPLPTAMPTVQTSDEQIVATAVQQPPVVVQPVIIQQPAPVATPVTTPPAAAAEEPALKLSAYDVFIGLVVIGLLLYGVYRAAKDSKGDPRRFDQGVATTIERVGSDRERMDRLEQMLASQNELTRDAVAGMTKAVGVLAAVLPGKSLDAAATLLNDLQVPGAPPTGTYHVEGTLTADDPAPAAG
jgi:hypothetical protein